MDCHVNHICRAAFLSLHKIGKIRSFLDRQTTERLVHAFISSRLDNCNSLLFGLPDNQLAKLQRIQNSAARLVTRCSPDSHITPILHDLHWLPVKLRIDYKVILLTYKCIHGIAPSYLSDLVQNYTPARRLRSSSKSLLVTNSVSTRSYGQRSFQYASALLWNGLPEHVKGTQSVSTFKTRLKTHMFSLL